jgi:short-subunit dehydrogenase
MAVFLVTGASQGIGAAIARAFAAEPEAQLALVSRSIDKLDEVANRCRGAGAEATVFPCDVTNAQEVAHMAVAVQDQLGLPDVVVNNAGLFRPGSLFETNIDSFRAQIDVNLISAFLVTKAFLDDMTTRGSGQFVYMASVASLRAYPGGAAYCATKHGLLGLARSVREETRTAGLKVTTILAGATYTPSWEGVDLPEERFMPAEDVARAVLDAYHLSDRSVVEEILIRPQLGDI